MSGTAVDMLDFYRAHIGLGEPNFVQAWYRGRNGKDYAGNFAWCDATVTYAAYHTGNYAGVCWGKDWAYTVAHADAARSKGKWVSGTLDGVNKAQPGDIVFFDWGGTNGIGNIDHVGIVEKNLGGGRVQTLEGNTGDRLLRRVRSYTVIAGYFRPAYAKPAPPKPWKWDGKVPSGSKVLKRNDKSNAVKALQAALVKLTPGTKLRPTGTFGPLTGQTLKAFQKKHKLSPDEQYGPKTAAALVAALKGVK